MFKNLFLYSWNTRQLFAIAIVCAFALLFVPDANAQQQYGIGVDAAQIALVNVACYATGEAGKAAASPRFYPPLVTTPKSLSKTVRAPDLQPAYNGVYVSLSSAADYLDYMQPESGPGLTSVNLRFDRGNWTTTGFEMPQGLDQIIVPLYDNESRQVGLLKLCSPTFSQTGSTLCTNLHIRAVVNHQVVIPPPGFDLQRVEDLNAASGSGITCS